MYLDDSRLHSVALSDRYRKMYLDDSRLHSVAVSVTGIERCT